MEKKYRVIGKTINHKFIKGDIVWQSNYPNRYTDGNESWYVPIEDLEPYTEPEQVIPQYKRAQLAEDIYKIFLNGYIEPTYEIIDREALAAVYAADALINALTNQITSKQK